MDDRGRRVVPCDVSTLDTPDLRDLDTLCRLKLAAQRAGFDVRLDQTPFELLMLVRLAGLEEVLRAEASSGSEEPG